jgi:hypothetical protein
MDLVWRILQIIFCKHGKLGQAISAGEIIWFALSRGGADALELINHMLPF